MSILLIVLVPITVPYSCTDPNCPVILVGELLEKYTFSVDDYENYSSLL